MPFKKGISGNPISRSKGSVSTTNNLIREHISQAIDGTNEALDSILVRMDTMIGSYLPKMN
jgi:hypothetical protein|tara:strand:- start:325 stop:507 length:183 start_codon:yes stop_codon:yes gene_type:complete